MVAVYRQTRQRQHPPRREGWQAAWVLLRAEPWRVVTLPISLALAGFLEWALELSGAHSPIFWWRTAVGVSAVILGSVCLSVVVRARWKRRQRHEENV